MLTRLRPIAVAKEKGASTVNKLREFISNNNNNNNNKNQEKQQQTNCQTCYIEVNNKDNILTNQYRRPAGIL